MRTDRPCLGTLAPGLGFAIVLDEIEDLTWLQKVSCGLQVGQGVLHAFELDEGMARTERYFRGGAKLSFEVLRWRQRLLHKMLLRD